MKTLEISAARIEAPEAASWRHWTLAALIAFGIGAAWRYYWLYYEHPPSNNLWGDMRWFVDEAMRLLQPGYTGRIDDTLHPPGMAYWLALTYLLDNSWQLTTALQFLMSLAVPLLLGAIGEELFGWREARLAVIISSFYFPFIDYAGHFLSENPFLFWMLLSFWLLLRSLRAASRTHVGTLGVSSGLCFGIAAIFKGQALVPGFLIAGFLALVGIKFRWRRIAVIQAAVLVGALMILIPVSIRTTRLNDGRFSLITTYGPLNFLLGHSPNGGTFTFDDKAHNLTYSWCNDIATEQQRSRVERFDFGSYDGDKVMAVAMEKVRQNKIEALGMSIDHVFELFLGTLTWPSCYTNYKRWTLIFQQIYLVAIFLPACFYLIRDRRTLFKLQSESMAEVLLLMPVIGLLITAFMSYGEVRYRIPFDGFIILLASRFYAGGRTKIDNVFTAAARKSGKLLTVGDRFSVPPIVETSETNARRHWSLAATIAFGLGAVWRYYWLYYEHPPGSSDFIYADMQAYVDHALRLVQPGYSGGIVDTINPPGMSYFMALTWLFDPTWQVASAIQFLASLALPLLIGAIGEELFGWRVARLGLILASLYYPFIGISGYFLADAMFMFFIVLAFWLILRGLRTKANYRAALVAATSGALLGAAIAFKGQAIVPGVSIALFLAFVGWLWRWKRIALIQVSVLTGLLAVTVPLSVRQTRLNEGRFCLTATNGPLNFFIGHNPEHTYKYVFDDTARGICWFMMPVGIAERYPLKEEYFHFGIYESDKMMVEAWEHIGRNKIEALCMSVDNVFDLFCAPIWPDSGNTYRRIVLITQQLSIITILLPALYYLFKRGRSIFSRDPEAVSDLLLLTPLLGICITAFLVTGEARYRIPFDGFLILLAARCYTGGRVSGENVFAAARATKS